MTRSKHAVSGVSLIELMIALLIGSLLILGLVEVFAASRTAYQMSEGMARVQENSRFAMDYLQRDLRMGGHFGCVNDQAHLAVPGELSSHFANVDGALQFNASVQGYEADGTEPGKTVKLPIAAGAWTPVLPAYINALGPTPGSDVVVLRFLSNEGVSVSNVAIAPGGTSTIQIPAGRWSTLTNNGVADPRLFGLADCNYADIFEATTNPATGTLSVVKGGLNDTDFTAGRYSASPPGQVMLYRAEAMVYYIAPSASGGGQTSLWRARFNADGGGLTSNPEELVEGIESLQLLYGLDARASEAAAGPPMGYIDQQVTAATVAADDWQYVGLIRVGLLARSPNRATAQGPGTDPTRYPDALSVRFEPPSPYDGNYRTTYESTIALRNRLYGN